MRPIKWTAKLRGKLLALARRKPRDWARQEAGREYKEPIRPLQRNRAA
jgi:hypothetical protein